MIRYGYLFNFYRYSYYINSLIKYATTIEHIKLYINFLGVSYKITNVIIKNIVFITLIKSKYHIPIAKEHNIITVIIHTLIINAIIPLPLAYQQINAINGEINVIPYHISI